MRDTQRRCFVKPTDDKRSRSYMTTTGMRTFRVLQPTVNNSTLAKYQSRTESPRSPLDHSTPIPPPHKENNTRSIASPSSTSVSSSARQYSPKPPSLGSTCSSPVQYYRTSDSYHPRTFTPRNFSCTPAHLYMADHVRKAALDLHRVSSNSSRQTVTSVKTNITLDNCEIPTRFGKPISLPTFVKTNPHLKNKELSVGQKQYLWGIARIYSMSQMKSQVQQQYQTLLDYEFKKRTQRMGISEREKIKEMKDYLRYKKFIKNYDQRIPRNLRSNDSAEGVGNHGADHIHKHVIKGWTTDITSRDKYNNDSRTETRNSSEKVESEREWEQTSERGVHIYKHVIKGWTMDPHANEGFERHSNGTELRECENNKKSEGKKDIAIYRVDVSRSDGNDQRDITKLYNGLQSDQCKSLQMDDTEPYEVIVRSAEDNFL